jgi:RNA polymerase sigma-70 factor, ECF subfamily
VTTELLVTGVRVTEPPRRTLTDEFAAFYTDYQSRLVGYCFRLVDDDQAAFDIAQEAFARLFTRWLKVREPAAYLFHVATNLARAEYTRRVREDCAISATVAVDRETERDLDVRLAVGQLPRRYRELVLLYYFADLPVADVARAVRRPSGTVMRQLSEARALLATHLKGTDDAR